MMNPNNKEEVVNSNKNFENIIQDGFVVISKETFERLKDFDFWKEWKHNPQIE